MFSKGKDQAVKERVFKEHFRFKNEKKNIRELFSFLNDWMLRAWKEKRAHIKVIEQEWMLSEIWKKLNFKTWKMPLELLCFLNDWMLSAQRKRKTRTYQKNKARAVSLSKGLNGNGTQTNQTLNSAV